MASPNEITAPQLLRRIGTPDCPVLVDVSTDADFHDDAYLVPGAFRHSHTDMSGLHQKLDGRACVIICQKGGKLSQGVAAWLRDTGGTAEYLSGGNHAWRAQTDAPRVPARHLPASSQQSMIWVTRHRPKIDRIACPWLIRRFVDAQARFLFVAPDAVDGVADRFGAIPFDVENTFWSHRGASCTFDIMVEEFGLGTPALHRLADVVRAADTDRHDLHPAAAGLLAVSVGLSRQYRDDTQQLAAGMMLYDALYRWARDGYDETHTWPTTKR